MMNSELARPLRNVGELNFPSPSNEVSGLGCGWASPALGRKEAGRKKRAGMLFEMHVTVLWS